MRFGNVYVVVNDRVMDRLVREAVRTIDAMHSEQNYLFDKNPQHHYLIESEARNVFSQGHAAAALKCASGFNMNGMMDCAIN